MPSVSDIAKQMLDVYKEAYKPVVASYQAQIPEVQKAYAQKKTTLQGEKAPMEKRYADLLNQVTGQQQVQENAVTTATSREFGRRGIPLASGAYEQYQNQQLLPVRTGFASTIGDVGYNRETDLRNLANQISGVDIEQTGALRELQNQIAQAQAGVGGLGAVPNIYGIQASGAQAAAELAQRQREYASKALESTPQYTAPIVVGRYENLYDPASKQWISPQKQLQNRYNTSSGGSDWTV
jgi:hypothetical protein